jgi:putative nucleotidyltransferase with HDIG domain
MADSSTKTLAILTKYVEKMPTFSPASTKILQLANNLNASPNEIVAAIRLDPVLTGKVLQLVNSAYFSLAQKVTSLNRALVYLGINTIKNLALSTAVMQTFDSQNKEVAEKMQPEWHHALAAAVCCKTIAKSTGIGANLLEEYFIAGLLHDIGRMIFLQALFETHPTTTRLSETEETALYGMNHSAFGQSILEKWKFSQDLAEAIGTHHNPNPDNKTSYFLHAADVMTYRLGLNTDGKVSPPEERPLAEDTWQVLGVSEEKILTDLKSANEQIEKAEVFLNVSRSKERVAEQP